MNEAADRRLNVLMVSTSYPVDPEDWKGLFIKHLADAFVRRSDVNLALWAPPSTDHARMLRANNDADDAFLSALMDRGGVAHLLRTRHVEGLFASARLLNALRRLYRRNIPDLYHINWLQNSLSLPNNGRPLLVTVLGSDMQFLRLPMMRLALRRTFSHRNVAICPNADWMRGELQSSFGDIARIAPVSFGIDPAWFGVERSVSNVGPGEWLVVSRLTKDKVGPLFEWSAPWFADGSRRLHLFGPMQEPVEIPRWVDYHGPASPESLLRDWFPHAQGLITLSRHAEGRPQVMLEAMAAGLPIIASRLPAHEDLLRDGTTGFLVDSPETFGRRLAELENASRAESIGMAARAEVRSEIGTWDDCAARYNNIYRDLLGSPIA